MKSMLASLKKHNQSTLRFVREMAHQELAWRF